MPDSITSWVELGSRLADARKAAGLTQADLGKRVGLDRTAITKIEAGQRGVDSLELAKIARVLSRTVDWFIIQPPRAVASRRSALDVTADRREDLELEALARDVDLLAQLGTLTLREPERPSFVVETVEDAERAAAYVRTRLGLETEPLTDLAGVAEQLGLVVASIVLEDERIDGSYVALDRGGVALLNGGAPSGRRRFTLAHEMGHHVLADAYSAEWLVSDGNEGREKLVNAFAVHLLLPRAAAKSAWSSIGQADPRATAIELGAKFGVSWTALCAQLHNLELVDDTGWGLLTAHKPTRVDFVECGLTIPDDLRSPFVSRGFATAVVKAFRANKISGSRAIEMLRGTISDADLPQQSRVPVDGLRRDLEPLDE